MVIAVVLIHAIGAAAITCGTRAVEAGAVGSDGQLLWGCAMRSQLAAQAHATPPWEGRCPNESRCPNETFHSLLEAVWALLQQIVSTFHVVASTQSSANCVL